MNTAQRLAMAFLAAFVLLGTRAGGSDVPRPPRPEVARLPGPLVLCSGMDVPNEVHDAFFALAGKDKARIVVIPTAIASPEAKADWVVRPWRERGALRVEVLHTRDRKKANDPAFVQPITEATAVWFTHGHRDRLLLAYRGTLIEKELKKLHARGGAIGGTGSGAAVLTEMVIDGVERSGEAEPGLGLLPGFLIADRPRDEDRMKRFTAGLARHPTSIGLAIEYGAAVVLFGRDMRVIGESTVTIHLAKGGGKASSVEVLRGGAVRDLLRLQREAASRAK